MPFVEGTNRGQERIQSLESLVGDECIARVIDVFVDSLDLQELGFVRAQAADEGRPSYDAGSLLKLYIYGHHEGIRSSRKLERACEVNVEVMWLVRGMRPDYRTIARFRKDNVERMKSVFREFTKRAFEVLRSGFVSVDGSKFQASCGKDQNFTAAKLDDRIARLTKHINKYMRQLDAEDEKENKEEDLSAFSREELDRKLEEAKARLTRYEQYREHLEATGAGQLSVTDPDAKLMKNKNGFAVSYNIQAAVDSETHLIRDYESTNQVTDHGLIEKTVSGIRDEKPDEILTVVADKGYNCSEDMLSCLENGIVPNVILPDGQDEYTLETVYEEADITEEIRTDATAESIRTCLRAGEVPEVYNGFVEVEVVEKRQLVREEHDETAAESPYRTPEEAKERAAEGYFVRDPERNSVTCPAGETLRQKSIKRSGMIRYANKQACRNCPHRNKCVTGKQEWKEIDFSKDQLEKPNRAWRKAEGKETPKRPAERKKRNYKKSTVVRITFRPNRTKMAKRMCLSEHPFGTVKRAMNSGYFLLRGLRQIDGEIALSFLGYNLKRAFNILGFKQMMTVMA